MAQHMYLLNQVCEHFVSLRTNVLGSSQLITDCCIADCSSVDALHKSVIIAINAKINVSLLRQLTAYWHIENSKNNKKAVLPQGNRAMPQLLLSV